MPKFRTLADGADGVKKATKHGRVLRRHRLDELPQRFSVLKGHMSLVGPRPELPHIVACYDPREKRRLCARPGATGLWQLHGSREKRIHEDIRYDLFCLRKATLLLDLRVVAMTALFMLMPRHGPD